MANNLLTFDNTMCWVTAHQVHSQYDPSYSIEGSKANASGAPDVLTKSGIFTDNGMYTLEIEIRDTNAPLRRKPKRFFIPRLFLHSFNIYVDDQPGRFYANVQHSWFMRFTYQTLIEFHSRAELDIWLDLLKTHLLNFQEDVDALFQFFQHDNKRAYYEVSQHLANVGKNADIHYRIEIFK